MQLTTRVLWALLLGVSPPPGAVLVLHSLPLEFPLAMAFAEQLLSWKSEDSEGKSEDEPDSIPTSVLLHVVELLGEVLFLGTSVEGWVACQNCAEGGLGNRRYPQSSLQVHSARCHHWTVWWEPM